MRKRKLIIALAVLGMLLGLGLAAIQLRQTHRLRQLRAGVGQIQLAVDSDGAYPRSIELLRQRGYLTQLPLNPYSGAPMRVLAVTDTPAAGDIVYVPCGPIIAIGRESAPADSLILPTEVDHYLLAAYGPLSAEERRNFPDRLRQWQAELGGVGSLQYRARINGVFVSWMGRGRDSDPVLDYSSLLPAWELFAVRLAAGNDRNLN